MTDPLRIVSRETLDRLHALEALVGRWTQRINLVAPNTVPQLWQRHIVDSAQLFAHAPSFQHWADLGSGGGFPGLVIAAMARELQPGALIHLVESDQRKCAFLNEARRALELPVMVHNCRIEVAVLPPCQVISARALAPLGKLLELVAILKQQSAICLFPKGEKADWELTEARRHWHIELEVLPSLTDLASVILKLTRFQRVGTE